MRHICFWNTTYMGVRYTNVDGVALLRHPPLSLPDGTC